MTVTATELRAIARNLGPVDRGLVEAAAVQLDDLARQKAGLEALLVDSQEEIAELKAKQDSGWRPIETAPKGDAADLGGPYVLLGWAGSENMAIGSMRSYVNNKPIWRDKFGAVIVDPTHWMPLPTPPNT